MEENIKDTIHPNAYLRTIRNVHCGLAARTRILGLLETKVSNASNVARETGLSYAVVVHHLMLLRAEGIVERKGNKRFFWFTTRFGQKRLD